MINQNIVIYSPPITHHFLAHNWEPISSSKLRYISHAVMTEIKFTVFLAIARTRPTCNKEVPAIQLPWNQRVFQKHLFRLNKPMQTSEISQLILFSSLFSDFFFLPFFNPDHNATKLRIIRLSLTLEFLNRIKPWPGSRDQNTPSFVADSVLHNVRCGTGWKIDLSHEIQLYSC